MKLHIEEQTVDVDAAGIMVRFNLIEDAAPAPVDAPVEVETTTEDATETSEEVEAPVETAPAE